MSDERDDRDEEQPVTLPDDREARLRCYRNALRNEASRFARFPGADSVYVSLKRHAQEWLRSEFAEYSHRNIIRLLHVYVEAGGVIHEVVEKRPEYVHYEFHYDLRVPIGGRPVYFETTLSCEDADDPDSFTIRVVSVKDV